MKKKKIKKKEKNEGNASLGMDHQGGAKKQSEKQGKDKIVCGDRRTKSERRFDEVQVRRITVLTHEPLGWDEMSLKINVYSTVRPIVMGSLSLSLSLSLCVCVCVCVCVRVCVCACPSDDDSSNALSRVCVEYVHIALILCTGGTREGDYRAPRFQDTQR